MSLRARVIALAVVVALCVSATVVVIAAATPDRPPPHAIATRGSVPLPQLVRSGYIAFRDSRVASYGQLELAPADRPNGPRTPTGLDCDRVSIAAGRGICLTTDAGIITRYKAIIFDARTFAPLHTLGLPGGPSRARMSPDGRLAAYTVFVAGDSYDPGGFSTRTAIVDVASGRRVADLEKLTVLRDGERIHAADFNFWGVTFAADDNRFYATLGTAGHTYLVEGDLAARELRVLRDGVECPSLSPDGTRIAFKQRTPTDGDVRWHPAILDLATMQVRALDDARNVDDQIAWLDDDRIAFGVSRETGGAADLTDIYAAPADGSRAPELLVAGAWSPQVVPGLS